MDTKFHPTQAYSKDTGLIVVLILLLFAYWQEDLFFIIPAIIILVVVMTVPAVLKPLAVAWYYIATALGNVTNRVILSLVFGAVLIPVGLIRRFLGYDPMKLKIWKKGVGSVFKTRDHVFTSDDLKMPY